MLQNIAIKYLNNKCYNIIQNDYLLLSTQILDVKFNLINVLKQNLIKILIYMSILLPFNVLQSRNMKFT